MPANHPWQTPSLSAAACVRAISLASIVVLASVSTSATTQQAAGAALSRLDSTSLIRYAIDVANGRDRKDILSVPLDADGQSRHGMMFDAFRLAVIAARAAAAAGRPFDSASPPSSLLGGPPRITVVAFALTCGDQFNMPVDIGFIDRTQQPAARTGDLVRGDDLKQLLPGIDLPPVAVGASFVHGNFLSGDVVRISYASDACGVGSSHDAILPLRVDAPRVTRSQRLPPRTASDTPSMPINVSALVDVDGMPRFARLAQGPPDVEAEAMQAASNWRWVPVRVNGVPTPASVGFPVTPAIGVTPSAVPTSAPATPVGNDPAHETTTLASPGLSSSTSKCDISTEDGFGRSADRPIKTGGGAAYGPAREQRYLNALRGPAGEAIHFKRTGSLFAADKTILDEYEITYEGLSPPIHLYLDEYHYMAPSAPKPFLCGVEFNLAPPGPDPIEVGQQLVRLAIDLGGRPIAPIPLGAAGETSRGVIYDRYRLIGLAARAAAANGSTITPQSLPRELSRVQMLVLAYPQMCSGQLVPAEAVDLLDSGGRSAPRVGNPSAADDFKSLLPGVDVPPGTIVAPFAIANPAPGSVRIRYGAGCEETTMPLRSTPAQLVRLPAAEPPAGGAPAAPSAVSVQVLIDFQGVPHDAAYVNGPPALIDAAIRTAMDWRWTPPLINGAPILTTWPVTVPVR